MVEDKEFRGDLYERIEQRVITIPSLRERKEDIAPLVLSIVEELNRQQPREVRIDPAAMEKLVSFPWPGNIRQLKFYTEMRFHDAIYAQTYCVTVQDIERHPPRTKLPVGQDGEFTVLESLLSELVRTWDGKKGIPLKTLLEAMLSKIYLEDLQLPVTRSSEILGIDGSGGKDSTLRQRAQQYHKEFSDLLTQK